MEPIQFQKIDMDTWPRAAHYRHYTQVSNCTYSITVDIDITALAAACRAGGWQITPALTYLCCEAISRCPEMRFSLNEEGELGMYSRLEVIYPIFHQDDHTFTYLWTPMEDTFPAYHAAVLRDKARFAHLRGPEGVAPPKASFSISSIPWVTFSGFNLNILTDGTFFSPIITFGRYREEGGRLLLPFALQIHHAVADGYHAASFLNLIQQLADDAPNWAGTSL